MSSNGHGEEDRLDRIETVLDRLVRATEAGFSGTMAQLSVIQSTLEALGNEDDR